MEKPSHSRAPFVALECGDSKAGERLEKLLKHSGWTLCSLGEQPPERLSALVLFDVRDWRTLLRETRARAPQLFCIAGLPQSRLVADYLLAIEAGAQNVVPSDSEEGFAAAVVRVLCRAIEEECMQCGAGSQRLRLPCALAHIDDTGCVSHWNDAAEGLFALPRSVALGMEIDHLLGAARPILPLLQGPNPPQQGETAVRRGTGEEIVCQWRCSRPCQEGWAIVFDDITSRVQAEAELREAMRATDSANRAKSEFLAVMSHEIRTPMNSIIGFTELLLDQQLDGRQRDYLEIVRNNGISLLELINNVLEFSRIESGKIESEPGTCDLHQVVTGVVDALWINASRKGIDLFARLCDEVPRHVIVVENELRRILLNLVSNGIKFTDRGGVQIHVSLMQANDRYDILFRVADTGIGIPEDQAGKLFKSFSQIDSSSTRRHGGTGLGLAISRRLCEAMGGRMWMQSLPGKGSTFYFTLPLQPADPLNLPLPLAPARAEPVALPPRDVHLRILVAEDEPMNQLLVQRFLSKLGHECTLANNGAHALERLRESSFDLVLMDVQMPEMDGLQAAREIRAGRAGEEHRDVYICALTAYAMAGDQDRCLAAGMDDYASKPLTLHSLQKVIACAMNHVVARAQ